MKKSDEECDIARLKRGGLVAPLNNLYPEQRAANIAELITCASCDGVWKDLTPIIDYPLVSEEERQKLAVYAIDLMELADQKNRIIADVKTNNPDVLKRRKRRNILLSGGLLGAVAGTLYDVFSQTGYGLALGMVSGVFGGYIFDIIGRVSENAPKVEDVVLKNYSECVKGRIDYFIEEVNES